MRRCLTLLLLLGSLPASAAAQTTRVAVDEENFRAAPGGLVLGVVRRGTPLGVGEARGRWREATLEGWIWSASVARSTSSGFELQVSASGGENLRSAPRGDILGRLDVGTLLESEERQGQWVRVRRTGWIWEESIEPVEPQPPEAVDPPPSADAGSDSAAGVRAPSGAVLRSAPEGDSIAVLGAPAAVEVLETDSGWARIRIEGWVPLPTLTSGEEAVLRDIAPADLAEAPASYRGRLVEWEIQVISVEQASAVRTEFAAGEYYLLARGPRGAAGFVYVAISDADLPAVRGLAPLQRVRVVGRVRFARSPLTGAPVLELVELLPAPRR